MASTDAHYFFNTLVFYMMGFKNLSVLHILRQVIISLADTFPSLFNPKNWGITASLIVPTPVWRVK